jgi:iron complex outermembrane recepter protein
MSPCKGFACRRTQVAAAVAIAVTSLCAPAVAQTQTPPPAGDKSVQSLGAVTVTGTRRREPVRDVPVQLNVVPASELEQSGAKPISPAST